MPIKRLSARGIPSLKAGAAGRTDYFDSGANVPGFGLRVAASGRRTWFLMYRANGRQTRHTLGTAPPMGLAKARDAARRALLGIQSDEADPAAAKKARRTADTFGTLADRFIVDYAKPHKRSWRDDARQLRTMVLPKWKNRGAAEITRADVRDLLGDVARTRGGVTANRLRALLSKLFRWAASQDYLESNPAAELPKLTRETSRERVLSDDEIAACWQRLADLETRAAEGDEEPSLPSGVALWLRLRLLTAQRGGSVLAMRWADVDLQRRVWEIPAADMKAGHPHVVPLAPWVCELLQARREAVRAEAVFVLEGGRARRLRLGVTAQLGLDDFTAHDLRRTAATGMARAGIARFVVARVLGHTDRSVTGIYDRFEYLDEKRVALDTWARTLKAIVTGKSNSASVVPFTAAK
jgi:integrase